MTSASNQQITRCPKCGTAFRITQTQLQSAKGAVRCGSCLNVFKAMDYLVAPVATSSTPTQPDTQQSKPQAVQPAKSPVTPEHQATKPKSDATNNPPQATASKPVTPPASPKPAPAATTPTNKPEQLAILSSIKPLPITPPAPNIASPKTSTKPEPQKPVVRVLDKSSLTQGDDILISDDMEESKSETKSYEFDGFMEIDATPKTEVSLFERKIRDSHNIGETQQGTDESWAEMLIEDEDEDTPKFATQRNSAIQPEEDPYDPYASERNPEAPSTHVEQPAKSTNPPGLVFSLIADTDTSPQAIDPESSHSAAPAGHKQEEDEFILSDELANIPNNSGFKQPLVTATETPLDPSIFETPDNTASDDSGKRQVKTQPKIRAYDGSRTALLMNIMPAPIEFTAKRMRRWYQRKLWPTLSLLALIGLIVQLGWFKFEYFSRVEPYRTAYTFLCPYFKCQVPPLVDTRQISAFNLVVREHPETQSALAVDVMIMNNAPFDQPYPDLVLVFTDIDDNEVASRRFPPKEYLGGEAAGSSYMPQKQPVHLTLDLVDPGEKAVNYHIYIPRQ
ncbi:DUF3426 domain-containing protein [Cellvibrio sp. KY-GH-1]|nr:DUF3426 domain-containing protein [Cellvibrio sp. KY-GH-1]